MGEGRGGWQGFGERGKCREVAGRGDGRRQEAGVRGAGTSTVRRQDWGGACLVVSEWAGARQLPWREQAAGETHLGRRAEGGWR